MNQEFTKTIITCQCYNSNIMSKCDRWDLRSRFQNGIGSVQAGRAQTVENVFDRSLVVEQPAKVVLDKHQIAVQYL